MAIPILCSALTALGLDRTSKLVFFFFQSLPSLKVTGIGHGSDQVS